MNNANVSPEQNFSIPMTPIERDNFSDFFDSNDFIFSERPSKQDNPILPSNSNISFLKEQDNISSLLSFCNQTLSNYGFSPLGDLQGPPQEINKTIKVVYELLQQRQRDLEFRSEIIDKIAKLESDKNTIGQNVVRLKAEMETLKKENGVLQNTNKALEKKFKADREKICFEKEEVAKQLSKLSFKETQMLHEIRKKENEANKYKEQMKKTMVEKNNKISIEILNNFPQNANGNTHGKIPDNIFLNEIKEIHDNVRHKLLIENQEMRNTLAMLQNELRTIIQEKKDFFIKKLTNDVPNNDHIINWLGKYLADINLIILKPEVFALPYEKIGNEIINVFRSNFKTIENFFHKIVDFNYFQFYFKEIKSELSTFHPNVLHSTSLKELKSILTKIKKPETLSQNASVKTLRSEENKENLIKEHEKTKSIIIIDDKKPMDISMRQFSKPYPQTISSSAGLKKKNASVHQLNSYDSSAKNYENEEVLEISHEVNKWEDCFNNKFGN